MRSSIACVRCRRSKVRCVNSGVNTTCQSCEAGGRDCTYPVPVPGGRRRDSSVGGLVTGVDDSGDSEPKRQRPRKSVAVPPPQMNTRPVEPDTSIATSPTDPEDLTPAVWLELFDTFQLHYSIDLPFIHPPTFSKVFRQASGSATPLKSLPLSSTWSLAFLALTVRFQSGSIANNVSQRADRPMDPLAASEYYANIASARLALDLRDSHATHGLEMTQGALMLAMYEWSVARGAQAWNYLGTAIRSAQMMGLQFEQNSEETLYAYSAAVPDDFPRATGWSEQLIPENDFVRQEIRRRTLWSCFVLDNCLGSGTYRPQSLRASELRIHLPVSERAFLFGHRVQTSLLVPDDPARTSTTESQRSQIIRRNQNGNPRFNGEEQVEWEIGAEEGLISRYVKILELYGRVVRWSCAASSRQENCLPWQNGCLALALRRDLHSFTTSLPRQYMLSPQNTLAHINLRTSSSYFLVHVLSSLCEMLLNREYLPLFPLQYPTDSVPYGEPRSAVMYTFMERRAEEAFSTAQTLVDLASTCQDWGVLVQTPIVGFALYNAALLGVYCKHYPLLDSRDTSRERSESHSADHIRTTLQLLSQLSPKIAMANDWITTVKLTHATCTHLKHEYLVKSRDLGRGQAGGLKDREITWRHERIAECNPEELDILDRSMSEYNTSNRENSKTFDVSATTRDERASDNAVEDSEQGSPSVRSEVNGSQMSKYNASDPDLDSARQEERWNAINTIAAVAAAAAAAAESSHTSEPSGSSQVASNNINRSSSNSFSNGVFRAYHHPPAQTPTAPFSNEQHPLLSLRRPSSTQPTPARRPSHAKPTMTRRPSYAQPHTQIHTNANANANATTPQDQPTSSSTSSNTIPPPAKTSVNNIKDEKTGYEIWQTKSEEDAWLSRFENMTFCGEDVAAFVDGIRIAEYIEKRRVATAGVTSATGSAAATTTGTTTTSAAAAGMGMGIGWLSFVWSYSQSHAGGD